VSSAEFRVKSSWFSYHLKAYSNTVQFSCNRDAEQRWAFVHSTWTIDYSAHVCAAERREAKGLGSLNGNAVKRRLHDASHQL
jgi:hypothetical protein